MLPSIKGTAVVVGFLLLTGFFVPLALFILAPVMLHRLAFHVFLAPEAMGPTLVFAAASA